MRLREAQDGTAPGAALFAVAYPTSTDQPLPLSSDVRLSADATQDMSSAHDTE